MPNTGLSPMSLRAYFESTEGTVNLRVASPFACFCSALSALRSIVRGGNEPLPLIVRLPAPALMRLWSAFCESVTESAMVSSGTLTLIVTLAAFAALPCAAASMLFERAAYNIIGNACICRVVCPRRCVTGGKSAPSSLLKGKLQGTKKAKGLRHKCAPSKVGTKNCTQKR